MQPMEKNVEKQLVVRTFEPDMNALKQTAKQLAHMQDTSLNLYGQAGEVLIVVTARAYAQAAATELTENVAEQFELALGPAAYGRGKGSLAYFTAGELIQSESTIAAADPATGALLAEEFSHTKRGPSVFDFGDGSYNDSRVVAKIKNAVYKYAEEGNAPQIAAARAAAAGSPMRISALPAWAWAPEPRWFTWLWRTGAMCISSASRTARARVRWWRCRRWTWCAAWRRSSLWTGRGCSRQTLILTGTHR